jgi:hypothetical protein
MRSIRLVLTAVALGVCPAVVGVGRATAQAPSATATIDKPKALTVSSGHCLKRSDGTLGAVFGPDALPPLAFTIGPGSAMADAMHASKVPFTGPGLYKNVIVMLYLGKTATQDAYGGLGSVTVSADGKSGTFVLNDKSASGRWSCGAVATQ